MIRINGDKSKMDLYDVAYPMTMHGNDDRCKAPHDNFYCSREKGHSGPHRYRGSSLFLWYDEVHEEEERVLNVCVRLGVIPRETR